MESVEDVRTVKQELDVVSSFDVSVDVRKFCAL